MTLFRELRAARSTAVKKIRLYPPLYENGIYLLLIFNAVNHYHLIVTKQLRDNARCEKQRRAAETVKAFSSRLKHH
ncbi:hypothetical protein B9T64_17705 [Bacillus halotolerans]|nr:hypothetical protein B9T64_17705 [Bacillus halotolerans]